MHPLIEENRARIAELCRLHQVQRLEVFGSILRDDFNPETSDVDVLADFERDASGRAVGDYFDFKEALEKLLGRKVDVVTAGLVRNPYVRRAIERSKVALYAA